MNIYVTGPMGSDRRSLAEKAAKENNRSLMDFDAIIQEQAGKSIRSLCMTMGEHEYRNKEYDLLVEAEEKDNLVCLCGDGILLDPMSAEILARGKILIADGDLPAEELWKRAREDDSIPYAFMLEPDEEKRREQFLSVLRRRADLYQPFL